jgi:hypothetical protein
LITSPFSIVIVTIGFCAIIFLSFFYNIMRLGEYPFLAIIKYRINFCPIDFT